MHARSWRGAIGTGLLRSMINTPDKDSLLPNRVSNASGSEQLPSGESIKYCVTVDKLELLNNSSSRSVMVDRSAIVLYEHFYVIREIPLLISYTFHTGTTTTVP